MEKATSEVIYLDRFLDHLSGERRLSAYTVRNYRQAIRDFHFWMRENARWNGIWDDLDMMQIRNFIIEKQASHSRRTIHNHFSALKTFAKYLVKHPLIKRNPFTGLTFPKLDKP
ncbi:MAG: site-specific integrase [Opitutae bacterium]|nr:site-specific integrase [Opitutae bacterium]